MHPAQTLNPAALDVPADHAERRYELRAIPLLALGYGMVGMDRFIINPLFPVMSKDLGLSYQDLGLISGVLALTWGLAAIFCGGLADRFGAKRVLVPAMVVFSLLVATTGLATGLATLLIIRGVMGVAEGAYMPAGIAATNDASHPRRIGLNTGLTQMSMGLFGMAIAPVLATQLLGVVPSWHWVFGVVAAPGLVLAYLLHRVLRQRVAAAPVPAAGGAAGASFGSAWREVLRYRNVVVGALCALCWLSAMIVQQAFMPNYLTDHLQLGVESMGLVLGVAGIGAMLGMIFIPALSDRVGRKPVIVAAVLIELVGLWVLSSAGADPLTLAALNFLTLMMNGGLVVTTVGPIATQSVPVRLAATAAGIVMGFGEIVGGAIVPAVTGVAANALGITVILPICMGALLIGTLLAVFGLREPRRAAVAAA